MSGANSHLRAEGGRGGVVSSSFTILALLYKANSSRRQRLSIIASSNLARIFYENDVSFASEVKPS